VWGLLGLGLAAVVTRAIIHMRQRDRERDA
jgi:hypothetical protein